MSVLEQQRIYSTHKVDYNNKRVVSSLTLSVSDVILPTPSLRFQEYQCHGAGVDGEVVTPVKGDSTSVVELSTTHLK